VPIHTPGLRDRHKKTAAGRRSIVGQLSLTAMVDMFTVLAIFLLQQYKETGVVIEIGKGIELPKATETRELKPAHIVIISKDGIQVDKDVVASFQTVKEQKSWVVDNLYIAMSKIFRAEEVKAKADLQKKIQNVVADLRNNKPVNVADFRRITLQADKNMDFLTIKKIMYTLTEAGASEINFAVIQVEEKMEKRLEDEAKAKAPKG
jgi:biopolymer transport protein ExbD